MLSAFYSRQFIVKIHKQMENKWLRYPLTFEHLNFKTFLHVCRTRLNGNISQTFSEHKLVNILDDLNGCLTFFYVFRMFRDISKVTCACLQNDTIKRSL